MITILLSIISFLLAGLVGLIGFGCKQLIKYKAESNKWKLEHSERLAAVEAILETLIK